MNKRVLSTIALALFVFCALTLVSPPRAFAQKGSTDINIDVRDYCDPDSFNAAAGPGTCVRSTALGAIVFSGLIAELTLDQSAGGWRFAPNVVSVAEKATLHLTNNGGETHTFTQVKNFGGGFVGVLNELSGNPPLAPECAQVINGQLVPQPPGPDNIFLNPGDTVAVPLDHELNAHYQCCIHPWMHFTITPRDENHLEIH